MVMDHEFHEQIQLFQAVKLNTKNSNELVSLC